jgi:hypothetical protein
MKRITFLLLISLPFAFSQCKKSGGGSGGGQGNGSGYYMKFKLDGNPVEYTSQPFAGITANPSNGLYTAVLVAYKNVNAGLVNAVTITLFSASPIAANVAYNDPHKSYETNGEWVPQNTTFWYDPTGAGYLTAGALADSTGTTPLSGVTADSKLTITEMTSAYVKGTFSGTVYRSDFQKTSIISAGQFYLKR